MARDDAASSAETLQEICKRPGFMLKRIHQVAMALFLEECKQFGITPSQYQALAGVRAYPGITQTALGRLIGQDRSTIALVVKSLLDRSLIQMTASTADRRSLSLSLQDEGMDMLRRVAPAAHRAQDRLLAPLPKERRAPFLASLTMLLDAHGALIDPLDPPK